MQLTDETARELVQILTELKQLIRTKQQPPPKAVDKIPQYVTMKQAADKLAVSVSTIGRMIASKQLDGLPIRSGWSIPLSSIQEYIRVHTQKADKVPTF